MKTIKVGDFVSIRTTFGDDFIIEGTILKFGSDWIELVDRKDKKKAKIIRVWEKQIIYMCHHGYGEE